MLQVNQLIGFGAGASSYRANAVNFDGSTYVTRGSDLTGAANGKLVTFSAWVKSATDAHLHRIFYGTQTDDRFRFGIDTSQRFFFVGQSTAGSDVLSVLTTTNSAEAADGWLHFVISCNMANSSQRHLYVNDASDLATVSAYNNTDIDFTMDNWRVGASPDSGSTNVFEGDLADVMLWIGSYIDLSVTANRRMFIDANGKPVDPDTGGAIATLGTPIVRLSGPTVDWHTNKGSGGGFTETGTLTDASTSPSD